MTRRLLVLTFSTPADVVHTDGLSAQEPEIRTDTPPEFDTVLEIRVEAVPNSNERAPSCTDPRTATAPRLSGVTWLDPDVEGVSTTPPISLLCMPRFGWWPDLCKRTEESRWARSKPRPDHKGLHEPR
jgi:hypothetical protein